MGLTDDQCKRLAVNYRALKDAACDYDNGV
ncbi:MAG: hypothetical protein QG666_1383, partial [Euryarchaeota archaeon]|nr:hypothetical protein [Euryarchaeota archaeon]